MERYYSCYIISNHSLFTGHYLRQLLRPDLREKLVKLGAAVTKARHNLLEIRSVYILQKAWRRVLQRRIEAEKLNTRHKAIKRIQSLWRGYWIRSRKFVSNEFKSFFFVDTTLRFTYGQAVFITAVCKALRSSHFILKMYKPCGIVCPRLESHSRD